MRRRAALLWNRTAGRRRDDTLLASIVAALADVYDIEPCATDSVAAAHRAARQAATAGLDALFVLGGDGSLRLAAGELLGTGTALGPLPGGTTNVVARALGLPTDPVAAARDLASGLPRELDVGRAGDRFFLMQLSGGLDARVMATVDPRWKRRLGKLAIAWTALREWARYGFTSYSLEVDGEPTVATGFVVANFAEYAGTFRIVPQARPDDGRLDLLLFRGHGRRAALGFALDLVRGRHAARPDVEIRSVESLLLTAPARLGLQGDGDPITANAPFEVRLSARRLRLLAPPH